MEPFSNCKQVTLAEMLTRREQRADYQKLLLAEFSSPVISFTLNIPGPYKAFPLAKQSFLLGNELLRAALAGANISICSVSSDEGVFGYESLYAVSCDAKQLKLMTSKIEETHPMGRFFDFDVIDTNGIKISREAVGYSERTCIICGAPVFNCSRSRSHSVEELQKKTLDCMQSYFDSSVSSAIASYAQKALLYELGTSPKPGLVDRINSGAHRDMDFFTFIDSACVLSPYFVNAAKAGMHADLSMHERFQRIQGYGICAEHDMFCSTNNVNTHKGIIFSLGILCCAAGMDYRENGGNPDIQNILSLASRLAMYSLPLLTAVSESSKSHGNIIYETHGIKGVRGEAASGFKSVKEFSLPILKDLMQSQDINTSSLIAFFHLLANVDDTNVISRADLQTLRCIQNEVGQMLSSKPSKNDILSFAEALDRRFIERNISAGGCADLLCITWFLYFLERDSFYSPSLLHFA